MRFIDTHVHFSNLQGDYAMTAQLARAAEAGVGRMVAVGGSCELNKSAAEAAEAFAGCVYPAIGFDRDQVEELSTTAQIEDAIGRLRRSIEALREVGVRVCAIGEIGLDYHYKSQTAKRQIELLTAQCNLAAELKQPVIVHSREADDDTIRVLESYAAKCGTGDRIGVLHCFTGSAEFANRLLSTGMMLSFSGILSFRNADTLRSVARLIPEDRLLIETDSPFLAPEPYRGRRNEPAFVRKVAETLAEVRGETLASIAEQTTLNAQRLFGI